MLLDWKWYGIASVLSPLLTDPQPVLAAVEVSLEVHLMASQPHGPGATRVGNPSEGTCHRRPQCRPCSKSHTLQSWPLEPWEGPGQSLSRFPYPNLCFSCPLLGEGGRQRTDHRMFQQDRTLESTSLSLLQMQQQWGPSPPFFLGLPPRELKHRAGPQAPPPSTLHVGALRDVGEPIDKGLTSLGLESIFLLM